MKGWRVFIGIFAILLLTYSVVAVCPTGCNEECPEGTVPLAKYEWDSENETYVCEEDCGGYCDDILVDGEDDYFGWWASPSMNIESIFVKAGQICSYHDIDDVSNPYIAEQYDIDKDISHVTFCGSRNTEVPEFPLIAVGAALAIGAVLVLRR